jgi:uncharacterized RDD family membrane protein YckC
VAYENRITIATPEGVELDLVLAGLGSRGLASLLDSAIQGAMLMALGFIAGALSPVAGSDAAVLPIVLWIIVGFLVLFGYYPLWETLASGRSPGKMATRLRVVRTGGQPVGFLASVGRNLVRIVDWLPFFYTLGAIFIAATPRNQRLGDLVAGTLVVREKRLAPAAPPQYYFDPAWYATWDVSAVTVGELTAVRQFLARRNALPPPARERVAADLAARLRPKVAGAPPWIMPEHFLEGVAAAKAARA